VKARGRWLTAASMAAALAVLPAAHAEAGKAKQPPDLSGEWRLDPTRSESPHPRAGRGGWGGRGGGGFPGGRRGGRGGGGMGGGMEGGMRGGERGGDEDRGPADSTRGGAARMGRLPDWIRIDATAGRVLFSDSTGAALLLVRTGSGGTGAEAEPGARLELDGTWKGDRLEVKETGPRGGKVEQQYQLEDKGRTLVIQTKIEPSGPRPSITVKRVYNRVES
jgi:hypothetical protein